MSKGLLAALMLHGRHFIGGFQSNTSRPSQSAYKPHQGKREMARRVRQMEKAR